MSHDPHLGAGPAQMHHEEEGEGNWLVSYADMMTLLVGFFVILNSFSKIDDEAFEQAKQSITREFGGNYEIPFADVANRIRDALTKAGLGDQFVIKQTDAGVEISFHGTVFFITGSADVKEEGKALLDKLIDVVKAESTAFDVTVEGHTDDVPLSSGALFRSNWELSSIRACRVLDSFTTKGFAKEKLTAVGYGETRPVVPNRDAQGVALPENQSQNRRVVIKIMKPKESIIGMPSSDATASAKAPTESGHAPASAEAPAAPVESAH